MRRIGGLRKIDETDRQLCALLAADPRMSNRALASTMGVTDETIAARLRRLRDEGVLATTVVIDWEAAGFGVQAMARVRVTGRPFRDIVAPLIDHPSTHAITETSGCCDGVVGVLARSLGDLRRYVATQLRPLPGISELKVELLVDDLKIPETIVTLPIPRWDPDDLPSPAIPLDDVDRQLLRELIHDGHESNSEIARRLRVSDATIRRRIQRLEESGLLKVVAAFDPVATGDLTAVAFAFTNVDDAEPLERALDDQPEVVAAYYSLGSSEALLLLGSPTEGELTSYASTTLPRLPGVMSSEIAYASEVLHHRSHLVRIAGRQRATSD